MSTNRLVLNTGATYIRSLATASLSLFSSRWVLIGLGENDYGLYNLVGTLIVLITFFNTILAGSVARHFAFSIGRKDQEELVRWFNTSLSVHLCLAVLLALLGWPVGEFLIRKVLSISPNRINASLTIFRFSLLNGFFSMINVPYTAMYTAKQNLTELAFWNLLQPIGSFVFSYILLQTLGDRLVIYAIGQVVINSSVLLLQSLRAGFLYTSCRIKLIYWFDWRKVREIVLFALYNSIGNIGYMLRSQGLVLLLNLRFGPKVNSAFGIANQVSTQTVQLSQAMLTAVLPEITSREGRGERKKMLSLTDRSNRNGVLLILFFAVPLFFEMEYVIKLWLSVPPAYTVAMCQLFLVALVIEKLSSIYTAAINAVGARVWYHTSLGIIHISTIPIAWLFLKFGFSPSSVVVAVIITVAIGTFTRVFWARHYLKVIVVHWLKIVVLPCIIVALCSCGIAYSVKLLLPQSFMRLCLTTVASFVGTILISWFFVFDKSEKDLLRQWKTIFKSS